LYISHAQEPSSSTAAFAPLKLPRGTVSQTIFTVLLTLIYSNAVSKLYFSREHVVSNFVSASGWLCTNTLFRAVSRFYT